MSSRPGPLRTIGIVGGLGFVLGFFALLGALVGHFLDQRWGTGFWLTLVGTLAGTAVGFYEVIRALQQLSKEQ